MARPRAGRSIDDIVREAIEGVVQRDSAAVARAVAEMTATLLDAELPRG